MPPIGSGLYRVVETDKDVAVLDPNNHQVLWSLKHGNGDAEVTDARQYIEMTWLDQIREQYAHDKGIIAGFERAHRLAVKFGWSIAAFGCMGTPIHFTRRINGNDCNFTLGGEAAWHLDDAVSKDENDPIQEGE